MHNWGLARDINPPPSGCSPFFIYFTLSFSVMPQQSIIPHTTDLSGWRKWGCPLRPSKKPRKTLNVFEYGDDRIHGTRVKGEEESMDFQRGTQVNHEMEIAGRGRSGNYFRAPNMISTTTPTNIKRDGKKKKWGLHLSSWLIGVQDKRLTKRALKACMDLLLVMLQWLLSRSLFQWIYG